MKDATSAPHLAIDIGNTATKVAAYHDGELIGRVVRFTNHNWSAVDDMVTNLGVQNIILSTVANVPPAKWTDKWNKAGITYLELSAEIPLPFTSAYKTMATLGKDRIAAVAGSLACPTFSAPARLRPVLSRGSAPKNALPPRLIVDAGTCMTLDLIDADRHYLGGNISPGIRMRLKAMHEQTAHLPLIEPGAPDEDRVGRSTAAALRHGGQFGAVYEVEGLYHRLRADYPGLELILTGGDAATLAASLSVPYVIYPNLVLRGLHQIMSYYVQNES